MAQVVPVTRSGVVGHYARHSEHIGLHVGLASSLDDFGAYGTNLKCSHTIGD